MLCFSCIIQDHHETDWNNSSLVCCGASSCCKRTAKDGQRQISKAEDEVTEEARKQGTDWKKANSM